MKSNGAIKKTKSVLFPVNQWMISNFPQLYKNPAKRVYLVYKAVIISIIISSKRNLFSLLDRWTIAHLLLKYRVHDCSLGFFVLRVVISMSTFVSAPESIVNMASILISRRLLLYNMYKVTIFIHVISFFGQLFLCPFHCSLNSPSFKCKFFSFTDL